MDVPDADAYGCITGGNGGRVIRICLMIMDKKTPKASTFRAFGAVVCIGLEPMTPAM